MVSRGSRHDERAEPAAWRRGEGEQTKQLVGVKIL